MFDNTFILSCNYYAIMVLQTFVLRISISLYFMSDLQYNQSEQKGTNEDQSFRKHQNQVLIKPPIKINLAEISQEK